MENTQLIESQVKPPPQGKITFEEFLAWADEDTHAEWEDEEIIMASPASRRHQELSDWLNTILRLYVRQYNLGWTSSAPFLIQLKVRQQGRGHYGFYKERGYPLRTHTIKN